MRIYIDTETGGLDPRRHPVIQIAAVAVDGDGIVEEFERKLQFRGELCDPEALSLNSYDAAVWKARAVNPVDAAINLKRFVERFRFIQVPKKSGQGTWLAAWVGGWNSSFDVDFVMALANSPGWQWTTEARYIPRQPGAVFLPWRLPAMDIMQRFAWWSELSGSRPDNLRLETAAAFLGVSLPEAHDALADARAAAEIDRIIRQELRDLSEKSNG